MPSTDRASPLTRFRRQISEMRALKAEIRTMCIIQSLPADIRKDIGWCGRMLDRD